MNNRKTVLYVIALTVSLSFVWFTGPARPTWAQGPGVTPQVEPEAVVPVQMTYQGRVTNPGTGAAINGTVNMSFRIYNVAVAGAWLWEESKDVTVSAGLFSVPLGDVTPLNQALFNGQSLWLGVKLASDAEAAPRQQLLPVAYAMSLVPGSTIATTSAGPALTVNNAGTGNALRVEGTANVVGNLTVGGNLIGGAHNHDALYYGQAASDSRFVNVTGDSMSANSTGAVLDVTQSGAGPAGQFTSAGPNGLRGDTASIANDSAGIMGVAGWTPTSIGVASYAGVYGKSLNGLGVAGVSDSGYGLYGQSGNNFGVRGYSSSSWGGYFSGGTGNAIYANGTVMAARVGYTAPRTHYLTIPANVFTPRKSGTLFDMTYDSGSGGGCVTVGTAGSELFASVFLPDGATVTEVRGYFNRTLVGGSVSVTLFRLRMTGGYTWMANLGSTTSVGYQNVADAIITSPVVDNTSGGYLLDASFGSTDCSVLLMGVRITYTLPEAP